MFEKYDHGDPILFHEPDPAKGTKDKVKQTQWTQNGVAG